VSGCISRRRWLATSVTAPWLFPAAISNAWAAVDSPPITTVVLSPDGDSILAGSQAGVSIRNAASGEPTGMIACDMDNVHDLQFSPRGDSLAVAGGIPGETGIVEFYSWPQPIRQRRIETHDDSIYSIDHSADGSRWAVASGDEVCSLYLRGADKAARRFTDHSRAVLAVRFLPDSRTLVTASRDQTLRVWNSDSGESIRTLHNHSGDVTALAVKPSPRTESIATGLPMIASASADLTVRFWQPTIGRMVRFARVPSQPLCLSWIAGGEQLVVGCQDGQARVIDPLRVAVTQSIDVSPGWLYSSAADSRRDRRVIFGTTHGETKTVEF
jgi:WD40 repeat protein